jgi:hypothetical protein
MSGAATGLFSNWNAKADLKDAHSVAIDQATIDVLRTHRPEMASLYIEDDLPEAFERLLDRATGVAGSQNDTAFIDRYQNALATLIAR